jgi:CDP-diacylglycerol--serine O-phosphatidyltransferase
MGLMRPKRRIRPIAVLPTLFTLGNLCCGFFAIVVAARVAKPDQTTALYANMSQALWDCTISAGLIFLAMVFDALDGYVARLAKTPSNFGAQLDSLADLVTFGVAPAFLLVKMCPYVTTWHKEAVWVIAATFASCVALRLARFNVEASEDDDHMEFSGLPSPAGGAAIAGYAFMFYALGVEDQGLAYAATIRFVVELSLPVFAVFVAALMVSRIPYPHLVSQLLHGERSFRHVVLLVFAVMLVWVVRWYSVPLVCSAFVLVGPIRYVWQHVLHRHDEAQEEPMF